MDCADGAGDLAERLTCEELQAARDVLREQYHAADRAGEDERANQLSQRLQDVYEALDRCEDDGTSR